jgi:hypothetical protein
MEIVDREAKDLSLMHKQKYVCNGQRDGRICKHYWRVARKVESINPEALREGEILRSCLKVTGQFIEMAGEEVSVQCNMYQGRKLPLLQRPLVWLNVIDDPFLYNEKADEFNPMTPEEIEALHSQRKTPMPSFPVKHSADPVHSIEALKAQLLAEGKLPKVSEEDKMSPEEITAAMENTDGAEDAGKVESE